MCDVQVSCTGVMRRCAGVGSHFSLTAADRAERAVRRHLGQRLGGASMCSGAYLWKAVNGLPIITFETKRPPASVIYQTLNFRQKGVNQYKLSVLLYILHFQGGNILSFTIFTFIIQNI